MIPLQTNQIHLAQGWSTLWARVSASLPPKASELMLIIAAALVAFAAIKWLWAKHRGSKGHGGSGLAWTLIIAAVLAAPQAIIPIIMAVADFVLNTVLAAIS